MSPARRSRRVIRLPKVLIPHRGEDRPVILEVDVARGSLSVRLKGCRNRRSYNLKDLWCWKVPQLQLPLVESPIKPSEVLSEEEALAGFAEIRRALSQAA